jgi:hypothetical protein
LKSSTSNQQVLALGILYYMMTTLKKETKKTQSSHKRLGHICIIFINVSAIVHTDGHGHALFELDGGVVQRFYGVGG